MATRAPWRSSRHSFCRNAWAAREPPLRCNLVGAGLVPARPVPEGRGDLWMHMGFASNYIALTKPRITLLVVLTALAGYLVGARSPFRSLTWLHLTLGVTCLSAGISTLNQYLE